MIDFRVLQLAADAQNVAHATSSDSPPTSINKAPPAFIVAIETVTIRDDREGGHLAQYAFASAQGHPIFLDLLRHIVEVSRAMGELVSHFAVLITKSFSSSALVTRKPKCNGGLNTLKPSERRSHNLHDSGKTC